MKHVVLFFVLVTWNYTIFSQQNWLPATGNIGINTVSPSQALEVNGIGLFTGNTLGNATQTGVYLLNGRLVSLTAGGGANSLSLEGQHISFYTGSTYAEKMRLTATGKLGLGSIEPLDKIHIYTGPSAAYGASGGITISDSYTAGRFWDSGGGPDIGTLDLYNNGTQNVRLIANGHSYINGGNLGIGTSTPSSMLHLYNTNNTASINVQSTTAHSLLTLLPANSNNFSYINLGDGSTYGWQLGKDIDAGGIAGANGFYVYELTQGNHATRFAINKGGNIGIGTSTPSERLSVNGNVKAKKVIVSQTGWPDYVFDSSYTLRSLSEVEKFITQHKRLPEMPSAKEVEEKGISVGDNQALLLKKIEELTLHMILQDKLLKKQSKQINDLQKKLYKK